MATIDLSFEVGTRRAEIIDDVCAHYGWTATVVNSSGTTIPNPVGKPEFMKNIIRMFIRDSVAAYRVNRDVEVTRKATTASTDAAIVIT